MKIVLCPIGDIQGQVVDKLQEKLLTIFGCKVLLREKIKIPDAACDKNRRQYNAVKVLDTLQQLTRAGDDILLGIADIDLFTEQLNFIFGLADINSDICLISLARLRQEFYGNAPDEKLFHERILKEAVHEMGHILGLEHCPEIKCVMHFSNSLQDTDIKDTAFCHRCRPRLV